MRISGWSSDVCSSDLAGDQPARAPPVADDEAGDIARTNSVHISICTVRQEAVAVPSSEEHQDRRRSGAADVARGPEGQEDAGRRRTCARPQPRGAARANTERSRSEGTPSEIPPLMST